MSFKNIIIRGRGVDSRTYHEGNGASRGDKDFEASSSMLREFAHCPARWRAGYKAPETSAKDFGGLLDTIILTPNGFQQRYIVQPATYESSGMKCPQCGSVTDSAKCAKCKCDREKVIITKEWTNQSDTCAKWVEDKKAAGIEVVTPSDFKEALAAGASMQKDEILSSFLNGSQKQVWLTGQWIDDATGLTIPVKALLDLVPDKESEFSQCIGDLKSTRSAKPSIWSKYSSQRGYHLQSALYLDMWNAATEENRDTAVHLLVESYEPYQIGRSMVSLKKLDIGRALYKAHLTRYAKCLATNTWPDYEGMNATAKEYGGWSLDEATKWDEAEALSAIEEIEQTETEQNEEFSAH